MTSGALLELRLLVKRIILIALSLYVTLIPFPKGFVTILFLLFLKLFLATGSKFPRDVSSRGLSGVPRGKNADVPLVNSFVFKGKAIEPW